MLKIFAFFLCVKLNVIHLNRNGLKTFSIPYRDFEEESPCDWMEEVEKMFSEH